MYFALLFLYYFNGVFKNSSQTRFKNPLGITQILVF